MILAGVLLVTAVIIGLTLIFASFSRRSDLPMMTLTIVVILAFLACVIVNVAAARR